uniref:C2H2-type domain-containing protein n=1 Tax=Anopheles minimus TaxID=112268 RepID=A0A182WGZ6_9DIPT
MDGMCFDYDHYFSEETFIIDDFGEICEDVVRIASANTQYLCKDFDAEPRQESPPPGSYIASNRCFEKEVTSLFSEMEYLTEVSPGTDVVLADTSAITIAVNPSEFSCKRSTVRTAVEATNETFPNGPQHYTMEAILPTVESRKTESHPVQTLAHVSAPLEYQRILNNYIQKGRRKLEASSYSKMKASCLARERLTTSAWSTSTIESLKTPTQPSARAGQQCPSTSATAIVNNLPVPTSNTSFDKASSISDSKRMIKSTSSTCPTHHQSAPNRPMTGLLKTARLYHCRDCSSSFISGELLRKHSCIIAEQYQCHLCLREFKKRKTLDHHMKSHDKVFSTDDDLRK